MKRKQPIWVTAVLLAALVMPSLVAAQKSPRYSLIDLGTFGGPASYLQNGFDGILNNHGTLAGFANTSVPDPFCFVPNCVATHAFRVRNGKLRDLGTLPGGDVSQAVWTSENGLIVGMSQNGEIDPLVPGFAEVRAVMWRNGKIIDLGRLPQGGFESLAGAVNNRGQVVGLAITTVPDPCSIIGGFPQTRAFLWQGGAMEDLGTLGGPDALAELVNDRGQVAGASYTSDIIPATGCPELHPFLWHNGSMLDLGTLGGTFADVRAMNQHGQVVGFSNLAGDLISHPFLWTRRHLIDLGTLGGDTGLTNWINDRGDIVGKADLPGPAPQLHDAVLWRNGEMIDLGVLPGDSCSNAYFVNSHGQVVGTSENQELCLIPVGQHAILWEHGGSMVDLNTLIPPGASLDLTLAVAINDRGEIAGIGVPPGCAPQDYEFCGHAYMLIPCEHENECTNITVDTTGVASTVSSNSSKRVSDRSGRTAVLPKRWQNRLRQGPLSPVERTLLPN